MTAEGNDLAPLTTESVVRLFVTSVWSWVLVQRSEWHRRQRDRHQRKLDVIAARAKRLLWEEPDDDS